MHSWSPSFPVGSRPGAVLGAIVSVAIVFGLSGSGARAQVPANPDSVYRAELANLRGEPLALDDAIARAMSHATSVREAEADVRAAKGVLRRESGAFDPVLYADWELNDDQTATASPFAGADVLETRRRFTAAGARLKLPIGTELEAALETTRLETNSDFAALDPQYTTIGRLALRQPLLNGFGPGTAGDRASARHELEAARARLSEATIALEAEVTSTYWELYAAERNLAVQRLIATSAEGFLRRAQFRAEAGLAGPSEVATARVFVTQQELSAIDREESLDEVSDRLVTLLGPPVDAAGRYHAATEPPADIPVEGEEALIARAMERNHDLRAARRDLEARRAEAGGARWNSFPTLDLVGSLGGNGLTGTPRPVVFGTDTTVVVIDGEGYGQSVEQALKRDFPTWSVGVELEVPIGFREGRGERDRLAAQVSLSEERVAALERSLREEIRARHRELRHGLRRLDLARQGVDASFEQVRIGQIEYENGRSTAFEVVRLGADLATAQERYTDALVRTAKAAAELRRLAPPVNPSEEER